MYTHLLFGCHALWARVKETTNTALAWSQIKTKSLKAYLFTQEINPFELCTICYTTYLWVAAIFFKTKMDTGGSGFTAGPSSGSRLPHAGPRNRNQAWVQFAAGLPEERSDVDFGTRFQSLPTNPAFFSRHVGSETHWRTGEEEEKEEEGRKKGERGEKQPQGWSEILYACALKHKVCGQLLKDFSGESRLSTESIEWGRERRRVLSAYASATQFCWGNRETLSALFFSLFFRTCWYKKVAPCYSTCTQPLVANICECSVSHRFPMSCTRVF